MKYRGDIDGLRAVAVVSVVLYHANIPFFTGGFVGVDVFFVISGYLITSIIKGDIEAGNFSFLTFYERRIRRIFPALFAVIGAVLLVGLLYYLPRGLVEIGRSALSTLAFVSNFYFWQHSGYFDAPAHSQPLLHTWSLAVEEQFYILLPPLLLLLARLRPGRALAWLWAGAAVSLGISIALLQDIDEAASFYLLPSRAWELAAGSLIAFGAFPALANGAARETISLLGLAAILAAVFLYTARTPFPGLAAILPVFGTAALIQYGQGSLVGRVLSSPLPVGLGLISYSLYLWHWPMLVFGEYVGLGQPGAAHWEIALASVAAATASYFLVERPIRRASRVRLPRRRLYVLATAASALFAVAAGGIMLQKGFPKRFDTAVLEMERLAGDRNPRRKECHGNEDRDIPFARNCLFGDRGTPPSFAVWGDSHAAEIVLAMGEIAAQGQRSVMQISYSGCPPALDVVVPVRHACARHNQETLDGLLATPSIKGIFLIARYHLYDEEQGTFGFEKGFEETVRRLQQGGKVVYVIYPIPDMGANVPETLAKAAVLGRPLTTLGIPYADYVEQNRATIDFFDRMVARLGVVPVKPADVLCDGQTCRAMQQGQVFYYDSHHLSLVGSRYVGSTFRQYLLDGEGEAGQ